MQFIFKKLCKIRIKFKCRDKVILVEGISEKIYIPSVFEHEFKDSFINQYISIIEVGGITFKNFLPLFIGTNKKVICISDVDYEYDGSVSYSEIFKEEVLDV